MGKLSAEEGQLDRAQRTFRALLMVLGRSSGDEPLEVSRGEVLFELSTIARKENDLDRAEELLDSALHTASENPREAERFERALGERGDYALLVRSLEARLGASANPETRALVLGQLAYAYGEHLGLSDEIKARLKGQLDRTLSEFSAAAPPSAAAWAAIEEVYARVGEVEKQAEALVRRIALATAEGASDASVGASPFYRLAEIRFSKRATQAEGVSLLERALAVQPDFDRAAGILAAALAKGGEDESLVRLYERVSRGPGREKVRADALVRLVSLAVATPEEAREAVTLSLAISDEASAELVLRHLLERDASPDRRARLVGSGGVGRPHRESRRRQGSCTSARGSGRGRP